MKMNWMILSVVLAVLLSSAVADVGSIISKSMFEDMLKHRDDNACPAKGFYTYSAFLAAARSYPKFGTTGDDQTKKRELAAFLAQTSHETTGMGAGSSTEPQGVWDNGIPAWDPQGNINYQHRYPGGMFNFARKIASHNAQRSLEIDAAVARAVELERECDEARLGESEWRRKSGELEKERDQAMYEGDEVRHERDDLRNRYDDSERRREQLQQNLNQSHEALAISNQFGIELSDQVAKLKIDVAEEEKMVVKAFTMFERIQKK